MPDDASTAPQCPPHRGHESFTDAEAAVTRLDVLYNEATAFLASHFSATVTKGRPSARIRAFYPEIRITLSKLDTVMRISG